MSVTDVIELFLERGANVQTETLEVWRVFQVTTSLMTDGPLTVAQSASIPQIGAHHPDEDSLICYHQEPKPFVDGVTWKVKCSYRVPDSSGSVISPTSYPWNLPAEIGYSFDIAQNPLENCYAVYYATDAVPTGLVRGTRNKKVTNSADQPFDPTRMFEEPFSVISIQRNVRGSDFDVNSLKSYQGSINNDAITIDGMTVLAYQGKCRDYKATPAWFTRPGLSSILYYQEVIEIVISEENWIVKIVDQGKYTGVADSLSMIKDTDGDGVMEPVLLNGFHSVLTEGEDPVYVYCHILWEKEWGGWLPA